MIDLATLTAKIVADTSGFAEKVADAQQTLDRAGEKMMGVGKMMTAGVTVPIVGIGTAAVLAGNRFNEGMANVASLGEEASKRISEWSPAIQQVAIDVAKGTGDMTQGLYQVVSAFGAGDESMQSLALNAKLGAAGLSTTSEAIALTSAVTKGYGDTSAKAQEQAADLAMKTVQMGQVTFPELAASIGRVVPIASTLGVTQQELFAVMATGTGVTGTASEVSTQLRGVLQSLMAPTDTMATLIESMGFKSGEAMLEQLGLQKTIETVVGAAEASGTPLQNLIGNIEGQTLALTLAGPQAASFTEKLAGMESASGTMLKAFQAQTEGVNANGFAMEQAKVKVGVMMEKLSNGLAPAISKIIDLVSPLIDRMVSLAQRFADMDPRLQTVIVVILGVAAAIGPLLMAIGTLLPMITAIGTVVGVAGAALAALASPIGLVIAAIAAIIAIVAALVVAWNRDFLGIKTATQEVFGYIGEKIGTVIAFIKETINSALQAIRAWWQEHGDSVMTIVNTVWGAIKSVVETVMGFIKRIIGAELDAIKAFWAAHGETIMTVTRNTWEMVKGIIEGVLKIIGGIVDAFAALLKGDWEGLGKAMQDISNGMWKIIGSIFTAAKDNLTAIARDMAASIGNAFNGVKDAVLGALSNLGNDVFNAGAGLARRLAEGIMSNVQAVTDAASALAAKVKEFLPGSDAKLGPLSHLFADGAGLVERLAAGILSSNAAVMAAGKLTAGIAGNLTVGDLSIGGAAAFGFGAGGGMQMAQGGQVRGPAPTGGGNTYNVNIYNPVGNPAAVDLVRTLRNMAMVGMI